MDNREFIIEAKNRIKKSILKDNLLIFFSRVLEDLKKEKNPNLFGRVKELYFIINPYDEIYEHKIYKFFKKGEFSSEYGIEIDEEEKNFLRIFFEELKRDFHLKNPSVMKGRIKGILNKLCEKYLTNSSKVIEPEILLRIISAVGSAERIKNMPSSTIQLIGAEEALFRHISKGNKPPKYGLIYYSRFVQQEKNKGKKARQIANKLAITLKIDYFRKLNQDNKLYSIKGKNIRR